MRRLVAQGGKAVIREEPEPRLRHGEVLVRTEYSVMSPGTERTVIDATAIPGAESHEYPEPRQQWRKGSHERRDGPGASSASAGPGFASIGYSLAGQSDRGRSGYSRYPRRGLNRLRGAASAPFMPNAWPYHGT